MKLCWREKLPKKNKSATLVFGTLEYGRTESFPFPFLSQGNFGKFWKETFPRIFKSFPRFGKRLTKPFLLLLKPFLADK